MSTDKTHSADLSSWVASAGGHADFPIQNLPLGIGGRENESPGPVTRIGDDILPLMAVQHLLPEEIGPALSGLSLNSVFALEKDDRVALRKRLSRLLTDNAHREEVEPHLFPADECRMHLPAQVGDYTDFYVGIHHAMNIGKQFRPDNPLLPNYKWIPIGYHGRASSVRVSGTPLVRPNGQRKGPDEDAPTLGPSRRLDYELEMAVWIGGGNSLGKPVKIGDAPDRIAGLGLLNDWSARDIQAWEYQPLGPFLAKSFLSTVSPWVVTAEALEPFRIAQAPRAEGDPAPLPYLSSKDDMAHGAYAIELTVHIATKAMRDAKKAPHLLSRGPAANMYWTIAQMIAHHTVNGCDLNAGDLLGTGTISGPDDTSMGSLMELSRGGKQPVELPGGETRTFLEDGDEIILSARAIADGAVTIGFGEARGIVKPARSL